MLHYNSNLEDLYKTKVPLPTTSYQPISNVYLINALTQQLFTQGLTVTNNYHTLYSGGQRVIGYLGIQDLNNPDPAFKMMLAYRNSYDKSMSVALAAGAMVMICSNGMVIGDITYMRRHTKNVFDDLSEMIYNTTHSLRNQLDKAAAIKEVLHAEQLGRTDTAHIIGDLFYKHELLRANQLTALTREIEKSENFAMPNGKGSAWNLYNNITEVLKKGNLGAIEQNKEITQYFLEEVV